MEKMSKDQVDFILLLDDAYPYQKWVYTDHNEECLFPCEPDEKDEITFLFEQSEISRQIFEIRTMVSVQQRVVVSDLISARENVCL